MKRLTRAACALLGACAATLIAAHAQAADPALSATAGIRPNVAGQIDQALRYRPDGADFVIVNGREFFNRSLYGGNTGFRVDGGDKPEFMLYLPGRGGNLRLAVRTRDGVKWLHDMASIETRYRPGELLYDVRDPLLGAGATVRLEALAYAATEGLILRVTASGLEDGAELVWAYGGVNGKRGRRDGDIGTEPVPISEYFQFQAAAAEGNRIALAPDGFMLTAKAATIAATTPPGAHQHIADAAHWNDISCLLAPAATAADPPPAPVAVGSTPLRNGAVLLLSLQRADSKPAGELATYAGVNAQRTAAVSTSAAPRYAHDTLREKFDATRRHFAALRGHVAIDTPDPWLNAAAASLNVVADALWDDKADGIMHGSIAWRTKLLGWRGPYALDALGWHDRARRNFATWTARQNTSAVPERIPPADQDSHLARSEAALHSNGDMAKSHYDMNMGFIDALFRHLLWTGDLAYARTVWPVIERHLAWEQRLFRREYGPDKLPLYEGYAAIWASDDLYYSGGGTAHASAYNHYAFRSAARLARLLGKDGAAYEREADLIARAMRQYLWMPERGAFGEYRDLLGLQRLHPSYGLWTFYHTIDAEVPTATEAWRMAADLRRHLKPIPVTGPGVPDDARYHVLPTTDWMPYSWSINNVVMGENLHTALALWRAGEPDEAFALTKSALLASMFMGISPGNVGTMNYLDVYRREAQRDFADGTGVTARALVEGLFGLQPDALARTLTVRPGFPRDWRRASIRHPLVGVSFERDDRVERWTLRRSDDRFARFVLRLPAAYDRVREVTVNGAPVPWRAAPDAVGAPALLIEAPFARQSEIRIEWDGDAAKAGTGVASGEPGFERQRSGDFTWLTPVPPPAAAPVTEDAQPDWRHARNNLVFTQIDLRAAFNDSVTAIFKPGKYVSPRSPFPSLSLPSQGIGAWAGHVNDMAHVDDTGLRAAALRGGGTLTMPNGVPFSIPTEAGERNIVFTSRWDNYPVEAEVPLCGRAAGAWLLMAGSTNHMQSRIDNGEVVATYEDGGTSRLPLTNPGTWWPIQEDYLIDDYQFRHPGPVPARVDLKTARIRLDAGQDGTTAGKRIDGGAATALHLPLDPARRLRSLTVRALSNDVVIGLMSVTLERPGLAVADCIPR